MMGLTYEKEDRSDSLETFEWDNLWCERATDIHKKRILIIGDSISYGYRHFINEQLNNKAYADNYASSKAVDNKYFFDCIKLFTAQNPEYAMIIINNGLHGWHLNEDEYKMHYKIFIEKLLEYFHDIPIAIALSTPVRNNTNLNEFAERNDRVKLRNVKAKEIADELGLKVIDLYALVSDVPEYHKDDGVHLIDEGSKLLSSKIGECVVNMLKLNI